MTERTLEHYLKQARECNDAQRLRYDFGIDDNFHIRFFGDSQQILKVLKDAFMNSPQPEGLQIPYELRHSSTKGDYVGKLDVHTTADHWGFMDHKQKVWVSLRAREETYGSYQIGGLLLADTSLMLHPHTALSERCDEESVLYLKPVVLDIADLIVKKNLTAGFTHCLPGEEWYHVPES